MSNLKRALMQERKPGIYRFDSQASVAYLRAEAGKQNWLLYALDGKKISDKPTFLDKIARAMKFPDYFGKNWDALNDCLTDMEWARGSGYILLYQAPDRFIKTSPEQWKIAVDIFNTAIEFWGQVNIPFYVLLRGGAESEFPLL